MILLTFKLFLKSQQLAHNNFPDKFKFRMLWLRRRGPRRNPRRRCWGRRFRPRLRPPCLRPARRPPSRATALRLRGCAAPPPLPPRPLLACAAFLPFGAVAGHAQVRCKYNIQGHPATARGGGSGRAAGRDLSQNDQECACGQTWAKGAFGPKPRVGGPKPRGVDQNDG